MDRLTRIDLNQPVLKSEWEEAQQRIAELEEHLAGEHATVDERTEQMLGVIEVRDRAIERCQELEEALLEAHDTSLDLARENARLREELLWWLRMVDDDLKELAPTMWAKAQDRIKELEAKQCE